MRTRRRYILLFLILSAAEVLKAEPHVAADQKVAPCMSCQELLRLRLPEVSIDSALSVDGEGVAYCRVLGVIGKEIRFELLLPEEWNRRFVMGGGGGFVGSVMNRARSAVHKGFATVGTDTGHEGMRAGWALNNMERQLNFGHMAVHRTAETSKTIIFHYYLADPDFSYFVGLSRGGGQAMMEAQRYPGDFDGIVAGAPAFNWVGQAAEFVQNTQAVYPDPEENTVPLLTRDNLKLVHKMVLKHCDDLDGVRDSILNDPRDCRFDLNSIPRCRGNVPGPACLTKQQAEALQVMYDGVGTGDELVHPGFPFGGEGERTGWFPSLVGPNKGAVPYFTWQAFYGMETFRYLVFNDSLWNYPGYDLTKVYHDTRYASAYLDAINPDYSAFRSQGGKMILYQGWIDPLISALDIIRHYEHALTIDPELPAYIRLFMLPGITHTGGNGPGKADWFQLIQDWVEKGIPPDRVIVSKMEKGETLMARPVFPYPRKAVYDGTGDPLLEKSFR